jgi:hypothetical protein
MAAKTYRLRIGGDGKEFEAEGDKAFVLAMAKLYGPGINLDMNKGSKGGTKQVAAKHSSLAATSPGKGVSIREFVQQLDLKKHTDISVAFGYYLEKHGGKTDFSASDLNNCYYDAKMEASNTSQMIAQNIKTGRMMPSKQKGDKGRLRFTLTNSGEEFIAKKLTKTVE